MSKLNKSKTLSKAILAVGVVTLSIGLALLIRLVFFKPLPVEAPSEGLEIETQEESLPEDLPNDTQLQQEEQIERSIIE